MRTTPVLYAIHIGRLIKRKWYEQGKLKFEKSHALKVLAQNKIKLYKFEELDEKPLENVRTNLLLPEEPPLNENHPDWKAEPCYIYKDNDVLLEGIDQARIITNTLEISQLPPSLTTAEEHLNLSDDVHEEAQRRIKQSCIYDAYQELLPRKYLPLKPAFSLRRELGITDVRKCKLLLNNLVQLCDQHSGSFDKSVKNDGFFTVSMRISDKLVQLELSADILVGAKHQLSAIQDSPDVEKKPIPDLSPLDCTISIKKYHFYTEPNIFQIMSKPPYVHTIFFSHPKTQVKNLYDGEVTESQILGRNLMKLFAAAATQAKSLYGGNALELINPVIVQGIMTDGQYFHFSVLQLNALDITNGNGMKNLYWSSPFIPLYEKCEYLSGMPILKGYNPEVLRKIMVFFNSK